MLVAYDVTLQIVRSCICQIACEFTSQATNIWRSYSNTPIDVLSVIDIARSFFLRTVRQGCLKYFSACKNDGTALRLVQNLHTVPGLFRLFFCYVLSQYVILKLTCSTASPIVRLAIKPLVEYILGLGYQDISCKDNLSLL